MPKPIEYPEYGRRDQRDLSYIRPNRAGLVAVACCLLGIAAVVAGNSETENREAADQTGCSATPPAIGRNALGQDVYTMELMAVQEREGAVTKRLTILHKAGQPLQYYVDGSQSAPQLIHHDGYSDGSGNPDVSVTAPELSDTAHWQVDVIQADVIAAPPSRGRLTIRASCTV